MRLLCATVGLLLFASATAPAQDPSPPAKRFAEARERLAQQANEQLRSQDLREVAWGAHTAAEFRLAACIPALRAQLVSLAKLAPAARQYPALAVLDALIQTDATVPGEEVKPFIQDLTTESALVLLQPRAENHLDLFLAAYRDRATLRTTREACGNVLADARYPDFALELLRERMSVVVVVFDAGMIDKDAVAFGTGGIGCRMHHPPESYPPPMRYDLASRTRYESAFSCSSMEGDELATRTRWLRTMLGDAATAAPIDLASNVAVEWSSLEQLNATEQEHRERLVARLRALAALCVKKKLVTEQAAAAIEPTFWTWFVDCRFEPKVPLPKDRTK